MGKIIDGKAHAAAIRQEVKSRLAKANKKCKLAVVLVGDNPASLVYINMKKKACQEVGIDFMLHAMSESAEQEQVLELIDSFNQDPSVTGILVQQPFPPQLDKNKILSHLDPRKDVDCLHPYSVGMAMMGIGKLLPCTPAGVMTLLKRENIAIAGQQAVVVGRSEIVGKPQAFMLLAENATVTICHSRTHDLPEVCRRADILVAALGKPKFITADMVKPGAVVIDVGVNRLEGKKVCGDVDYENCLDKVSYISPVPGGVGPMTVATLMENCVKALELQNG